MIRTEQAILDDLLERIPRLSACAGAVRAALELSADCFARGGRLFTCGNGGSAADADHVAGELLKSFRIGRPIEASDRQALSSALGPEAAPFFERLQRALPAIPLSGQSAFASAYANDVDPEFVFAQHLYALGRRGDLLWAFSTSGESKNVVRAAQLAKALGIGVVAFTGSGGGWLAALAGAAIRVPETETYRVQELHLPAYHALCAMLELRFFGT
jgi:D-sedoheptulose 7-phosphate isomerase